MQGGEAPAGTIDDTDVDMIMLNASIKPFMPWQLHDAFRLYTDQPKQKNHWERKWMKYTVYLQGNIFIHFRFSQIGTSSKQCKSAKRVRETIW